MVGTYLWAAGRRRTELTYATELRRAEEQHRRDLDRRVQQAQTDERARIAREIHDIVAHSLAVVNVQAATALAIGTENQMRQSLTTIKDASKDAITQMRSLVKVLREKQDSEVSGDLHRLITLTEQAQTTGVNLEHNLDPATLTDWQNRWPAAARLALIRAVQEGISNVIKHGGTTPHAHLNITEKTTPATYI
nr:histidine kinase [Dermatophilus congolensis]